ncbi:MAG: hypothetical protein QM802_15100 [Agriterribacter sp.]
MITRTAVALCLSFCLYHYAYSQDYFYNNKYYDKDFLFEISASAGAMNCLTDIGGRRGLGKGFLKDLNMQHTKVSGAISGGMVYKYMVGLRLDIGIGSIAAADSVLVHDESEGKNRYRRNLSFRSTVYEIQALGEVYPIAWMFDTRSYLLSPYIVGGIGIFHFNPQAKLNGIWVDLQPLHTEGEGFAEYPDRQPYKLTQLQFPVGIGLKYDLSAGASLRFEILHRITPTDYLDDVSTNYIDPALFARHLSPQQAELALRLHDRQQELDPSHVTAPGSIRGGQRKNDSYFTVQVKFGLILGRKPR